MKMVKFRMYLRVPLYLLCSTYGYFRIMNLCSTYGYSSIDKISISPVVPTGTPVSVKQVQV